MRKTFAAAVAALAALALSGAAHAAATKEEVRDILKKNPDILMDVLKENKKALFEIVNQAAQEEQTRRQKEDEEREKKEFDEAFKNPKKPELSKKTRIRGNKDAKFTLVEYSDFQCPYCSRGYHTVEDLRKKYGESMRFVFKHLPLTNIHPMAMPAARYLEAAAIQSPEKAWKFHDTLFENQGKLSEDYFKQVAKDLGLDVAKLEKDAKSPEVQAKIDADMDEAKKMGFTGTPGFLINGIPVKGAYPVEYFDMIIARLEGKKAD